MSTLELRSIQKRYRNRTVLRDASLTAEAGTMTGLIGSNGSGKSTLLGILAGVVRPDGGEFLWRGEDLFLSPRSGIVGYVPQGTPLYEELTARDNLLLWYGRAALARELSGGVLDLLGVGPFLDTRVSRLSGGMKKRLTIGCAMARHPALILLDEPSTALDLACKAELLDYLDALRKEGATLLLATHDIQETALCDRLYLLREGVLSPCEGDRSPVRLAELVR